MNSRVWEQVMQNSITTVPLLPDDIIMKIQMILLWYIMQISVKLNVMAKAQPVVVVALAWDFRAAETPCCPEEAPPAASSVMIFVWWEQHRPHTHMHTCMDVASYPEGNVRFMHMMFSPARRVRDIPLMVEYCPVQKCKSTCAGT